MARPCEEQQMNKIEEMEQIIKQLESEGYVNIKVHVCPYWKGVKW